MLKSIILCHPGDGESGREGAERLQRKAAEYGIDAAIMEINEKKPGHEYYFAIIRSKPDLIFTLDFAGFAMSTETGDIAYINLPCRNIHLIIKDREADFERYLTRKLSIAMFFYCLNHEIYDILQSRYPELPYLKEIADLDNMLKDVLAEAV